MTTDFDDIRPYSDEEIPSVLKELVKEPHVKAIFAQFFPEMTEEIITEKVEQIKTSTDFQRTFIIPFLNFIQSKFCKSLTNSGLENIAEASLILSNHRDIITDAAFLNKILLENDIDSTEIAIGDNLLIYDWIRDLVRINKSFIVKRNLPRNQMLKTFVQLSSYIRYTITEKQKSIWLAQREGRAKDSNDQTQESLIKMLALSGKESFIENLKPLRICPTSISYEYDPCDFLKAKEFQQKRDNPDFAKSQADDLISMRTGIFGYKGHVHYAFSPCINEELSQIENEIDNTKAQVRAVIELCDRHIFQNYVIYPINKLAYDELLGTDRFTNEIKPEKQEKVKQYLQQQLNKIDLPAPDWDFLRKKMLEIYANPLINYLKATGQ